MNLLLVTILNVVPYLQEIYHYHPTDKEKES